MQTERRIPYDVTNHAHETALIKVSYCDILFYLAFYLTIKQAMDLAHARRSDAKYYGVHTMVNLRVRTQNDPLFMGVILAHLALCIASKVVIRALILEEMEYLV